MRSGRIASVTGTGTGNYFSASTRAEVQLQRAELPDIDAIVLAGGRGSRLGGIDKAAQLLAGERLVDRTVHAARAAGARRVVVVGPTSAGTRADAVVREKPEFGGPLAALAAGLAVVEQQPAAAPWVWVLACDLEHPELVCAALGAAAPYAAATGEFDGVVLVDDDDRVQWLAGCYRRASLTAACAALGEEVRGAPVRRALGALELRRVAITNVAAADLDTPEALAEARARTRLRR